LRACGAEERQAENEGERDDGALHRGSGDDQVRVVFR
jgi:hypothetical protein